MGSPDCRRAIAELQRAQPGAQNDPEVIGAIPAAIAPVFNYDWISGRQEKPWLGVAALFRQMKALVIKKAGQDSAGVEAQAGGFARKAPASEKGLPIYSSRNWEIRRVRNDVSISR
jgi:hypothetical protein